MILYMIFWRYNEKADGSDSIVLECIKHLPLWARNDPKMQPYSIQVYPNFKIKKIFPILEFFKASQRLRILKFLFTHVIFHNIYQISLGFIRLSEKMNFDSTKAFCTEKMSKIVQKRSMQKTGLWCKKGVQKMIKKGWKKDPPLYFVYNLNNIIYWYLRYRLAN